MQTFLLYLYIYDFVLLSETLYAITYLTIQFEKLSHIVADKRLLGIAKKKPTFHKGLFKVYLYVRSYLTNNFKFYLFAAFANRLIKRYAELCRVYAHTFAKTCRHSKSVGIRTYITSRYRLTN